MRKGEKRFDTSFSIINGTSTKCGGRVVAEALDYNGIANEKSYADLSVPAYGSRIFDLDQLFPSAKGRTLYMMHVETNTQTRKHVLAYHNDGSISVDHFPN